MLNMESNKYVFFLVLLTSCNQVNDMKVVKQFSNDYFNNRFESSKLYLSSDFLMVLDNQKISKGMAYLREESINSKKIGTKFSEFVYKDMGNKIRVSYNSENWVMKCFGVEFVKNINTYFLSDKKIIKIEKSSFDGNKIDSIFIEKQKEYYYWLNKNGFSNEVFDKNGEADSDKYFEFLNVYCSENVLNSDISGK